MKRMYVVLTLLVLMVFYTGTLLGQKSSQLVDSEPDHFQKRMQMREEMHRRMMDKLLKGTGPDQDMFKDMEAFMDEVMSDSFSGHDSFTRTTAQNYKMEWTETSSGRTLVVTPKNSEQQLDIKVENGLVVIQGKTEHKSSNGISIANFSNSFNVPADCDPGKVKMDAKDGKIFMHFPFSINKAVLETHPKNERRPVSPSQEDVKI
jgi:HSP20 family molecular chaperone IbpA